MLSVWLYLSVPASIVPGGEGRHETMIERADWRPQQRAASGARHTLLFAVRERNVGAMLTETLLAVSDPESSRYGKHLTFDEVGALTSKPEATSCVHAYLHAIGADLVSTTPHGEFVRASHTVATWERELDTQFHLYEHEVRGAIVRTREYTLPVALSECVTFIGYTSQLPAMTMPAMHATPLTGKTKPGTVDPTLIKSFYNIDSFTASPSVTQSVFEAVGANFSPADLAEWLGYYSFPSQTVAIDIGGHNSSAKCRTTMPADCIEANLDLQYLMGTAQGAPTTYWYIANDTWPFMAWIEAVARDPTPATVHSLSYAEAGALTVTTK